MWGKNLNGIEMIGWKATLEVVKQKNQKMAKDLAKNPVITKCFQGSSTMKYFSFCFIGDKYTEFP